MPQTRTLHYYRRPSPDIFSLAHIRYHWPGPGLAHQHAGLQILVFIAGKTDITWPGLETPLICQAEDICIVPARLPHQVETTGQKGVVELIDCQIHMAHDSELTRAWQPYCAAPQLISGVAGHHAQLTELLASASEMSAQSREHLMKAASWILLGMVQNAGAPDRPQVDRRLMNAERFILDHLRQPISTPDIARAAGLSVSQLNRLYRQHRQITPAHRVMEVRLGFARELLPASLLTLKEIARECGFVCVNHFCRAFRQHVGMTPSQYRDHARTLSHPHD